MYHTEDWLLQIPSRKWPWMTFKISSFIADLYSTISRSASSVLLAAFRACSLFRKYKTTFWCLSVRLSVCSVMPKNTAHGKDWRVATRIGIAWVLRREWSYVVVPRRDRRTFRSHLSESRYSRCIIVYKSNEYVGALYSRTRIYAIRTWRGSSSYRATSAPDLNSKPAGLSIDGTDRRTDGRTLDRFMTLTACYTTQLVFVNFRFQFPCLVNRGTMGVNSLPKTVTRQRRGCDLNPCLLRLSPAR